MQRLTILTIDILSYFALLISFGLFAVTLSIRDFGGILWIVLAYSLVVTILTGTNSLGAEFAVKSRRSSTLGSILFLSIVGGAVLSGLLYYSSMTLRVNLQTIGMNSWNSVAVLIVIPIICFRLCSAYLNTFATAWVVRLFKLLTGLCLTVGSIWLLREELLFETSALYTIIVAIASGTLLIIITAWLLSGWSIQIDFKQMIRLFNNNQSDLPWRIGWYSFDIIGLLIVGIIGGVEYTTIAALSFFLILSIRYLPVLLVEAKMGDRLPKAVFKIKDKSLGIIRFIFFITILLALTILAGGYVAIKSVLDSAFIDSYFIVLTMVPGAIMMGFSHATVISFPESPKRNFYVKLLWLSLLVQVLGLILLIKELGLIGYGITYSISGLLLGISVLHQYSRELNEKMSVIFKFDRDDLLDYLY